jgi:hypothetical protein
MRIIEHTYRLPPGGIAAVFPSPLTEDEFGRVARGEAVDRRPPIVVPKSGDEVRLSLGVEKDDGGLWVAHVVSAQRGDTLIDVPTDFTKGSARAAQLAASTPTSAADAVGYEFFRSVILGRAA